MVASDRPDFYLPMFSVSRKEPISLLDRMFSDLQVPNSHTVVVVGENQCSDWLSQVSLPILKARQRPPLNPIELKSGRFLKEKQDAVSKEGERRQSTGACARGSLLFT